MKAGDSRCRWKCLKQIRLLQLPQGGHGQYRAAKVSDRSDSLRIDESEWLKGELEDCSVIAGDLEVPLYSTNELPHLQSCHQRGFWVQMRAIFYRQLPLQIYFPLLKDIPGRYVHFQHSSALALRSQIGSAQLFLFYFWWTVPLPLCAPIINN